MITATGANGGILVNSAAVTLKGNIDVSNNGFGGIEVSKNSSATENGNLTIADGATVVNTSEAYGLPTVWVVDGQGEFTTTGGFTENTTIKEDQTQYYLKEDSLKKATVNTVEDLQAAVANPEVKIINIEKELPALVTSLNVAGNDVTINGNGNTITFTDAVTKSPNHGLIISGDNVKVKDLTVKAELTDKENWTGFYAVQVYDAKGVTLNNVTATGANGGF